MVYKDREKHLEYNRQRSRRIYEQYRQDRLDAFTLFDGCCYTCGMVATLGRPGFHFHHVQYHPQESDYSRSSRALSVRLRRLAEVKKNPDRFRLLCAGCHVTLSRMHHLRQQCGDMNMNRLLELLELLDHSTPRAG